MIRHPAVEGRFYASTEYSVFNQLQEIEEIAKYPVPGETFGRISGAILPHAAHMYSAYQTVPFFRYLNKEEYYPETFVILNPNHTGIGPPISVDAHDAWNNCIGDVRIDKDLAEQLPYPRETSAQRNEHSAEVLIPFIQYYMNDQNIKIMPICLKDQRASSCQKLAADLISASTSLGRNMLLLASSDFSHFLSPGTGYSMDQLVLEQIERKDIFALEKTVKDHSISVCGYGPIMTLMSYSSLLFGEYSSSILARGHSGEIHPSREVVDYISMLYYSTK